MHDTAPVWHLNMLKIHLILKGKPTDKQHIFCHLCKMLKTLQILKILQKEKWQHILNLKWKQLKIINYVTQIVSFPNSTKP